MNQVFAATEKLLKEFLRDKIVLIATYIIPLGFLIALPLIVFNDIPINLMATLKGGVTLSLISLMIMISAISNLSGSIVGDRQRGLYRKISSMNVKPYMEVCGRILAVLIFSILGTFLLFLAGIIYGATFNYDLGIIFAGMFFLIMFIASVGIGLIIASFTQGESAATHLGMGFSLLIYFLGIGFPYSELPLPIQIFTRINPLSSAHAFVLFFLEGQSYLGYNPMTILQMILTITLSLTFLLVGVICYVKIAWLKK